MKTAHDPRVFPNDGRQADEGLRIANVDLGHLLEYSPAVLYVLKINGDNVVPQLISDNITNLLGFPVADTMSYDWWVGQLHPDDRQRAISSLTETITAGTSRTEYRLRHRSGQYRWVDDARRVIRDAASQPVEFTGVWTDITERKRTEEIARQAAAHVIPDKKKKVRIEVAILVAMTMAVFFFAAHFNLFESATQWILTNDFDQLDEMILTIIFFAVGLGVFAIRRWRDAESELTIRQEAQTALGLLRDELDLRVRQRTEELGNTNKALRAEVTERGQTEAALRESENQFRQVVENIREVFWMADTEEDRFLYISPSYQAIWGRSCESLYADPHVWLESVYPEDRERVRKAAATKRLHGNYDETYRIIRPDGAIRWIRDRAFPIRGETSDLQRVVGTAEDITDYRNLEGQFRQAHKMEAMGTLAAGIAHDFNNILMAIIGYTELARMVMKEDPVVHEYLGAALQGTTRATDLVKQILAFSRQQPQVRRPIQLQPVVAETFKLLRATIPSTIAFDISIASDAPIAFADSGLVHQILMNLGTNAWHSMKENPGRLQVKLERCVVDAAHAAMQSRLRPGVYARISISDTGCGMNPEVLGRIFEPFFTTKEPGEGTGLGLSVVHGIMDSHDGAVVVYSQPGEGTVFHLYFPEHAGDALIVAPEDDLVPRGHGERILLVDDEEVLVRLGQQTLVALGYEVETATQPAKALEMLQVNPQRFDLVLTDQTMPGMTGIVLATHILQICPGLPTILMTGYSPSLTPDRLEAAGIQQLLLKPTNIQTLGTVVRAVLSTAAHN